LLGQPIGRRMRDDFGHLGGFERTDHHVHEYILLLQRNPRYWLAGR
jgi:hypothetical protein